VQQLVCQETVLRFVESFPDSDTGHADSQSHFLNSKSVSRLPNPFADWEMAFPDSETTLPIQEMTFLVRERLWKSGNEEGKGCGSRDSKLQILDRRIGLKSGLASVRRFMKGPVVCLETTDVSIRNNCNGGLRRIVTVSDSSGRTCSPRGTA